MFFVIESSIANNAQANAITVKEDFNEARMVFHQIRAAALANPEVTYNLAQVIDDTGRVYQTEYHGQAVINPEPEPTEEPTEE